MRFADISRDSLGVREALAGMVAGGRVPHALMFHEDDGSGAVALALAFIQHLMCRNASAEDSCGTCPTCNKISKLIHPDVHFLYPVTGGTTTADYAEQWRELVCSDPLFTAKRMRDKFGMEGKSPLISVAQVRELLDALSLNAMEGGYRSVVIYLPELMNADAGNRLLKLIEEPPAMTQFILVTHAPEKVLVTIRSRCQCLRVMPLEFAGASPAPVSDEDRECAELMDTLMDALLRRDLVGALGVGEAIAALPSRERQKGFCIFASGCFRRMFLLRQGMESLAKIPREESGKYADWTGRCRANFPRRGLDAVSRASGLVERNVASKILFSDLVCRLYVSV